MLVKKIKDLTKKINRKGIAPILLIRLAELVSSRAFIYDRFFIFVCYKFNNRMYRKLDNGLQLIVQDAKEEDLYRLKRDLDINLPIILFQIKNASGKVKIITIEKNGETIAVSLFKEDHIIRSPSGYCLDLGEENKFMWVFGAYVHPRYRLKGYHMHLLTKANDLCQEKGLKCIMCEIHYLNANSISSHVRLGFEIYKDIHYLKILNMKRYFEGSKTSPFIMSLI